MKNLGFSIDHLLYRKQPITLGVGFSLIKTAVGPVRIQDSGGNASPIVFIPDGPCLIEHYHELYKLLSPTHRIICLDLPGFGYSFPANNYQHKLSEGASAIADVLNALNLHNVTLVASCVNGFYALAAAKADSKSRINRLVLSQTPSLSAMLAWATRTVPRPIKWPVIGQLINYVQRHKIAHSWYGAAVAEREQRAALRSIASTALNQQACYCFASVVQGVNAESEKPTELDGVSIPVTLVWGDADRSHKPTDPQSFLDHVPHAKLQRWSHVGHFPDLEDPARFASLLVG